MQLSAKDKVEHTIMRENIGQFKLAYSLLLLEEELYEELSILGEDKLLEDILHDHAASQEHPEIKEVMQLFVMGKYQ